MGKRRRQKRANYLQGTAGKDATRERREERADKIETEGRKCMAGHE